VRSLALLSVLLAGLGAPQPVSAWPVTLTQALFRDARRLVPRTLAQLLDERESHVLLAAQRFPPALSQAMATDLQSGKLRAETLLAFQGETAQVVDLLRTGRVNEGLVRLGGLLRIPADLADPVLTAGAEGFPAGVAREYYAFTEANLDKIPVVLDDPAALQVLRRELPHYWQELVDRSRVEAVTIRTDLYRNGRLVDHRTLDFHAPVFSVASLSYSRAVTAVAATWIAVWREAHGDTTRMPRPRVIAPVDEPAPSLSPRDATGPPQRSS
jgi:hypothetical protein